jgi:ribose-phosphate pyrophosphokinase
MKNFKLSSTGTSSTGAARLTHEVEFLSFPGGERHVRLPDVRAVDSLTWELTAPVYTPADTMDLLLVVDALRRMVRPGSRLTLNLPYVSYARQDRVALIGEPLSAKVFCNLINSLEFDLVRVMDPHSDVVSALLNNVAVVPVAELLKSTVFKLGHEFPAEFALVAPDAGARKKVEAASMALGGVPVVYGGKKRDPKTGALSGFYVEGQVPPDKALLVVDDICDGGYTFIALAAVLRKQTTMPLYLYVTHGLFTKGIQPLLDAGYRKIYCANCNNDAAIPFLG